MIETVSVVSPALGEWLPLWKATGCFLATFILEDFAAVGAGLLLAAGQIAWPAAFLACFLGIWTGDVGLYALARWVGRGWFERSALKSLSGKVAESERWFVERGTLILILSRMIPGARLPTYLAAGFLHLPLKRFLLVTGVASCVWTLAVLWIAQGFGTQLTTWLPRYKHGGFMLWVICVLLVAAFQVVRRTFDAVGISRLRAGIAQWTQWEFWPAWLFYPPVGAYCLWLSIKYRGLMLPTAANPGIFSGGIVGESKHAMLKELFSTSPEFTAEARLIRGDSVPERLRQLEPMLGTAFILKPDVGQRGLGIKLIRSQEQAESYLRHTSAPLVAQYFAPGPGEVGIFYYRFPHELRGRILAITDKVFPKIVGDGRSTITELIERDRRASIIADKYLGRFAARRNEVLTEGQELKLVESGNHAQGCIFRDGMHLWTEALEERIDEISQKLCGFFIGRYDIRYENEVDLKAGRAFQIIELNGAASEATSIYDARNSVWSAYRMLFRQWDLVFAIGAANRKLGCAPVRFSLVWKHWREFSRMALTYPVSD